MRTFRLVRSVMALDSGVTRLGANRDGSIWNINGPMHSGFGVVGSWGR